MERHFTATVYVYHPLLRKFAFIFHRKYAKWMPPGGHLEANERPDVAAIREVQEETGLPIRLVGRSGLLQETASDLPDPFAVELYVVNDQHEHIDFTYLGITDCADLVLNEIESSAVRYFSCEEVCQKEFETFENVKEFCRIFEKMMSKERKEKESIDS